MCSSSPGPIRDGAGAAVVAGPAVVGDGRAAADGPAVAVLAVAAAASQQRRLGTMRTMLTKSDSARIEAAIADAESKTSGEIFCVLARQVSRYREVPLLWAALAAFVVPPRSGDRVSQAAGASQHLQQLDRGFRPRHAGADPARADDLCRRAVGRVPLRGHYYRLAGHPTGDDTAGSQALPRASGGAAAFGLAGARLSKDEPHILIFASFGDRKVELVAHANIHEIVGKELERGDCGGSAMSAGRPADGFIKAIEICGRGAGKAFPAPGCAKEPVAQHHSRDLNFAQNPFVIFWGDHP